MQFTASFVALVSFLATSQAMVIPDGSNIVERDVTDADIVARDADLFPRDCSAFTCAIALAQVGLGCQGLAQGASEEAALECAGPLLDNAHDLKGCATDCAKKVRDSYRKHKSNKPNKPNKPSKPSEPTKPTKPNKPSEPSKPKPKPHKPKKGGRSVDEVVEPRDLELEARGQCSLFSCAVAIAQVGLGCQGLKDGASEDAILDCAGPVLDNAQDIKGCATDCSRTIRDKYRARKNKKPSKPSSPPKKPGRKGGRSIEEVEARDVDAEIEARGQCSLFSCAVAIAQVGLGCQGLKDGASEDAILDCAGPVLDNAQDIKGCAADCGRTIRDKYRARKNKKPSKPSSPPKKPGRKGGRSIEEVEARDVDAEIVARDVFEIEARGQCSLFSCGIALAQVGLGCQGLKEGASEEAIIDCAGPVLDNAQDIKGCATDCGRAIRDKYRAKKNSKPSSGKPSGGKPRKGGRRH